MEKDSESKFEGSPRKQQADSIKRSNANSSPSHQGPLSDYSPLKGPASIASFFAPPPQNTKSPASSMASSPQKVTTVASPHRISVAFTQRAAISSPAPVTPSRLSNAPLKSQIEDSGSDLTLSDGDDEGSSDEKEKEIEFASPAKNVPVENENVKPSTPSRGIPFSFNDEDSGNSSDSENEKIVSSIGEDESSDTDISVVISLPSTDSNEPEPRPVMRRYVDFSNSEYETAEEDEDEENDIPITVDSDDENDNRIPVMVFNSKQIKISDSPERKHAASPERNRNPSPKKEIVQPEPIRIAIEDDNVKPVEMPLKRGVQEIENHNVPTNQIRHSSPKKRPNIVSISNATYVDSTVQNNVNIMPQVQPPLVPIAPAKPVYLADGTPANIATAAITPANAVPGSYTRPISIKDVDGAMLSNIVQTPLVPVNAPKPKTGYVYDERMLSHFDPQDPEHPEKPARITSIYEKLRAAKLLDRSRRIPIHVKLSEFGIEVQSVHDIKYCKMINQTSLIRNVDELNQISSKFNSVYFNSSTAISATVAAAATIELCQSIGRGEIENGFAIVRPPGHHAEHDEAMGFCIYNNCAVAASSLLRRKLARKILILDWDVHHGNGTQNAFAESEDVLYISLHRYDGGKFYPHIEEANHNYIGAGAGLGKTVNVAWNGPGYGDADYMYAFNRLIMPIAREFNPDFVIVSAGFDAAAGDPIGECELTTYGYSIMLQEMMTLAGGKVALVLEGGYNLEVISKCYEACVKILLKEPPPLTTASLVPSAKAIAAVENSVISLSPYWRCLFPKPAILSINENTPQFPLPVILDHFWRDECQKHFKLSPIPGIFKNCSESFVQKYSNRVLASEGALFSPDVLIIFAHESGPIHTGNFVSSLCLQAPKINQSQPFLPLLQAAHQQSNYSFIDINLPSRIWKLKQAALGNEVESQELNVLFSLLWDRLISRSGCKNVFFVASGSPIYSIGHLINTREVESQVRGCFFFASTLFIPVINNTQGRAEWYQRNSYVVVPSQEPLKKPINNAAPSFGSCFSAGQWLMADSAAAVGDFKMDILNFIRTRLKR